MSKCFHHRMKRCYIVALWSVVCLLAGQCLANGKETSGTSHTFSHAGVTMTVPEGFSLQAVTSPVEVMRAVRIVNNQPTQAVILSAWVVGPEDTAELIGDALLEEQSQHLAVRDLKLRKKIPIKIAGLEGSACLVQYNYRGDDTTAARAYFIRELQSPDIRICYGLTVETPAKVQKTLLPLFGKMISGLKMTALQRPAACPMVLSEHKITNARKGITFRVPSGWFGQAHPRGGVLSMMDYLGSGSPLPEVGIIVARFNGFKTSEECVKEALASHLRDAKKPNVQVETLSQGKITLAGKDAHQVIIRRTVTPTTAVSQPASQPQAESRIYIYRILCVQAVKEKTTRNVAVILTADGTDQEAAGKWMDLLAEGLELLPERPAPQPKKADDRGGKEAGRKDD